MSRLSPARRRIFQRAPKNVFFAMSTGASKNARYAPSRSAVRIGSAVRSRSSQSVMKQLQLQWETGPSPEPTQDVDELFRQSAPRVHKWVSRLAGHTVDAEDVVQEVFLVVQRRFAEWRADAKISTWLYRITERV